MGAPAASEIDTALLIWRYHKNKETLRVLDDVKPDDVTHMVECDFARWRGMAPETTRAVLEDYIKDPKKYEGILKKHESRRCRAPKGKPYKLGDLAAAMDRLTRATSAARPGGP